MNHFYQISKERWFTPEEIFEILTNYNNIQIKLQLERINNPQAGMFYLFHRLDVPDFKLDGINWEKKKNNQKVHEQYLKLLIKGVHVITGQYTTCSSDPCFRRRSYRLADSADSYIQLVHYRNCEGDAYVRKSRKKSISDNNNINMNDYNTNNINLPSYQQQFLQNQNHLYNSNYQLPPPPFDHTPPTLNQNFHSTSSPPFNLTTPSQSHLISSTPHDDLMEEVYDEVDYEDLLLLVSETENEDNNLNKYHQNVELNYSSLPSFPNSTSFPTNLTNTNTSIIETKINSSISPNNVIVNQKTSNNLLSPLSTIRILDFAPSTGLISGGEKMLICLGQNIHQSIDLSQIQVVFSPVGSNTQNIESMNVPAEVLSPSVLRIHIPSLNSNHLKYVLLVCTQQGVMITLPSSEEFTYLNQSVLMNSIEFPQSTELNETINNINNHSTTTTASTTSPLISTPSTISRKRPSLTRESLNVELHSSQENNNFTNQLIQQTSTSDSYNLDDSRIHKIRIVEKFLTTNPLQITFPPPPNSTISEDDWLDDKSLSLLSSSDLEKLMDKYLLNVVNQLVQLAISDDDLKAELDHVDPSGYSLLHYCCLFNLPSLVEILISKGANVNLPTGNGSTPLHLASDSGHFEIVQQLVAGGANISLIDKRGLTAAESSFMIGQPALPTYWHLLSSRLFPIESFIPNQKRKNDSSSFATTPVGSQLSNKSNHFNFETFSIEQFTIPQSDNLRVTPAYILSDDESTTTEFDTQFTINENSVFSSVNDNKEQNIQLYTPPISRKSSIVGLDTENNNNNNPSLTSNTSMMLLQGAVSALSLADKCALSLSLGNSRIQSPDDFEVQSVLSDIDKESLDVAMSMMGPQELSLVEDEVRIIQNNVRTWLLRKNYINLRDAAKTLQMAWREKRNKEYSSSHHRQHHHHHHHQQQQQPTHNVKKERKKSIPELETIIELPKSDSIDSNCCTQLQQTHQSYQNKNNNNNNNNEHYLQQQQQQQQLQQQQQCQQQKLELQDQIYNSQHAQNKDNQDNEVNQNQLLNNININVNMNMNMINDNNCNANIDNNNDNDINNSDYLRSHKISNDQAASTLQAITRGMLARKEFHLIKRQTMASLVIQKSLLHWWIQKGLSNNNESS